MPIYGYACKNCGHTLDALQKIADDPLVECPECDEPELKRQLSAPRFRLKGEGWYETDFKKDNQRNLHGDKESSGDKGGDGKQDGQSDKKADSKADGNSATKSDTKPKKKADKKSSDTTSKA